MIANSIELFASRDDAAQNLGIEQRLPDPLARRSNAVGAFELHELCCRSERIEELLLVGGLVACAKVRSVASFRKRASVLRVTVSLVNQFFFIAAWRTARSE